jgi:signal transduction histidine kinase
MVGLIDAGMFAPDPPVTIVELDEETSRAFRSAIDNSLLVALAVSLVVAMGFSWIVARRILSPLARVREATVRLAQGHYSERVPVPSEEELAALAEDVNRLAARLEATEQRRTRLISDVAHELRTPLTTIQGSMEGLMDGVLEPGDQVWMSVAEEAARLQRVVADLGLLSQLDESALPLEMGPLQLDEVVRSVGDRLSPQYQDKQVELLIDVPAGLTIRGDRDRLAQVFTNLVGNALGHTPTGGRVSISGRSAAGMAEVTVADTGDGIPPDELEDIFERFHRGSGAKRHGTGLGLTIARSLARAHGGDVNAASAGADRGAAFTVRLPKHAKEEARLASWSSQRTGRSPAERVP